MNIIEGIMSLFKDEEELKQVAKTIAGVEDTVKTSDSNVFDIVEGGDRINLFSEELIGADLDKASHMSDPTLANRYAADLTGVDTAKDKAVRLRDTLKKDEQVIPGVNLSKELTSEGIAKEEAMKIGLTEDEAKSYVEFNRFYEESVAKIKATSPTEGRMEYGPGSAGGYSDSHADELKDLNEIMDKLSKKQDWFPKFAKYYELKDKKTALPYRTSNEARRIAAGDTDDEGNWFDVPRTNVRQNR